MSQNKKCIVTWDILQNHARTLAERLLPASQWEGIIAVSRGGLIPAALIARELCIRYIDTVCISSYNHDQQGDLKIIKRAPGDGKNLIIIDDLVDTGETAQAILALYPKAHFVAIFAKPKGADYLQDYVVSIPQDTWIELPWDMGMTYIKPLSEQ